MGELNSREVSLELPNESFFHTIVIVCNAKYLVCSDDGNGTACHLKSKI